MRMRARLALRIDALSFVLVHGGGRSDLSIRLNRERRHAAVCVVRDKECGPGLVDRDVAWPAAVRGHVVEEGQRSGGLVDGKRTDVIVLAGGNRGIVLVS